MDKPSFSKGASRRRMLTGTAAGLATALLQPACALRHSMPDSTLATEGVPEASSATAASPRVPALAEIPRQDFMELSAVLTGLYGIVTDPTMKELHEVTAEEYWRCLHAVFPASLSALVAAYRRVNSATGRPPLGDLLLERLRTTPEFKNTANMFVARQIVNIWYLSQFDIEERADNSEPMILDGGFHERALVWPLIKAHPPGVAENSYGYWANQP